MKLNPQTVKNIVEGWNLMYPYPKSDEELAFLATKFFKKLHTVYSDEAFMIAADMVEDEVVQFPTIAEMKKLANVVADKIVRDRDLIQKSLPEETGDLTEEEVANNLKRISIITDLLCKKITQEEADKQQKELVTYSRKANV